MDQHDALAERFEGHRGRLRAVSYRMLGSVAEADDAVQETWLRLTRTDSDEIDNLGGWLTTVAGRVCLNRLRTRHRHPTEPLEAHVPDPVVGVEDGLDPEAQALLADSVGLALLVVLDSLAPAERLAFVLHDLFAIPFEEIAPIVGRSATATRQLASRARRRVRGQAPTPDVDLARQREVVDAFFAAARHGDFAALLAVLDPDVVLRTDAGVSRPFTETVRGAELVAGRALLFSDPAAVVHAAVVNGAAGVVVERAGRPASVMSFIVVGGRVVEIDVVADPERLASLDLLD